MSSKEIQLELLACSASRDEDNSAIHATPTLISSPLRGIIALCVMVLVLSGCSQKAAFEELADGVCSSEQAQLIEAHISAQIDAIAKQEWKLAYSYASLALDLVLRLMSLFSSLVGAMGCSLKIRAMSSMPALLLMRRFLSRSQ